MKLCPIYGTLGLTGYSCQLIIFSCLLFIFRPLTLNEVINIIEEDDQHFDSADITIIPPPNDPLTDEDSADEDETGVVDNLSGRQLNAPASATLTTKDGSNTILGEVC